MNCDGCKSTMELTICTERYVEFKCSVCGKYVFKNYPRYKEVKPTLEEFLNQ